MNELDCKIVQDLLANYIENLTSPETNHYIENHLQECKDCKKVYDMMKKEVSTEQEKENKKIDYLKKYKRKMKILKAIVSIVIVLGVIFLGIKCYQWQFLAKIYDHNMDYEIGNNYRLTITSDAESYIAEMVYKDGTGYIKYNTGNIFWENLDTKYMILPDGKRMELNKNAPPAGLDSKISIIPQSLLNTENKVELVKVVFTKGIEIHEEEYRDRNCYVILCEGEKIWIDQETLFIIRDSYQGKTTDYEIEINTVSDEEVSLSNLNEV